MKAYLQRAVMIISAKRRSDPTGSSRDYSPWPRAQRPLEFHDALVYAVRIGDKWANDYGTYRLVDGSTNAVVASGVQSGYGLMLNDMERAETLENMSILRFDQARSPRWISRPLMTVGYRARP